MLAWGFAAQWWGLDWDIFTAKDSMTQSFLVAVYEAHNHIDSILSEAATQKTIN